MQVTLFALAALLTATVHGGCPARHSRPAPPPAVTSVISYSETPLPTTFATATTTPAPVVTPETTPTPVVIPETTPSASVSVSVSASTPAAPVASSAPPATDASLTTDQSSAFAAHNAARADVGVPALAWDAGLASDAQGWADHLAAQSSPGTLVHAGKAGQGENLYWSSQTSDPYVEAATAWIDEKSVYGGQAISSGGDFKAYGHYSTFFFRIMYCLGWGGLWVRRCSVANMQTAQIIWDTTTHVGMAIADDGQGGVYVVARYSPPGNM